MSVYRFLADTVVLVHTAYVLTVVLGQVAILIGYLRRWRWVRRLWLRLVHLAMIAVVVAEALLDITCPLTTLEAWLRRRAGETMHDGSFVGQWVHQFLFIDAPPWAFTVAYSLFGAVVLATFWIVPPSPRENVGHLTGSR